MFNGGESKFDMVSVMLSEGNTGDIDDDHDKAE